jgi:SAM-dependent methyltransferase
MKLWQVRRHWDALAKVDPYFAVLTDPDKQGHRWAIDEFFSTGVAEVEKDLEQVRSCGASVAAQSALDFGCGAGRLTQALAPHFAGVTGVDISPEMISLAREHCKKPNVSFVHNSGPHLGLFADNSFSFVYSRITLQHVAPRYTRRYLREFIRVLAPGGVLSVQVPESVPAGDPPDRLRFSIWPPTMLMRIRRNIRYHFPGWFPGTPKMQMYALSREEVVRCIAAGGAELLAVEKSPHDAVVNLTYIARKPK